jgi:hypothetical protein
VLPATGDGNQIVGSAAQLLADIVDEKIDAAALSHDPRQRLAADRLAGGKNGGLDAVHPFAPARLRRQVIQLAVEEPLA